MFRERVSLLRHTYIARFVLYSVRTCYFILASHFVGGWKRYKGEGKRRPVTGH
jgi:hypothetical protein